jgi:hypothetical protein
MTTTVMVTMTVEMGVMRKAAMVSVILQHRWESPFKEINHSTVRDGNTGIQPNN